MAKAKRRRYGPTYKRRMAAGMAHPYELAVHAGVKVGVVDALEFMDGKALARMRLGDVLRVADCLQCAVLELLPGFAVSADRWRKKYAANRLGKDAPLATEARPVPTEPESVAA